MSARLLLLEDDPAIARTVAYALERDGLTVTHSLLVHDARQQLQSARFDLLVLDVGLPDGSGLDLLRDVRNAPPTAALPVLMLSAHGEEIDRVLGLELGADDYLTKPFSPRELAARVKALLRRVGHGNGNGNSHPAAPATSAAAPFHDDEAGQRISLRGQALPLTRRWEKSRHTPCGWVCSRRLRQTTRQPSPRQQPGTRSATWLQAVRVHRSRRRFISGSSPMTYEIDACSILVVLPM